MHLSPTDKRFDLRDRLMGQIAAVIIGLLTVSAAYADCDDYYAKSGAAPGADDCMVKCTTGQTSLSTFSCPNHCEEYCGSANNPCNLQAYKERWGRPAGDAPLFSDREIDIMKRVGERLMQGGVTGALSQRGILVPPGTPLVATNQKHIRDILNAETDRERAEASLNLYLSVAFTMIGGDFENRISKEWMEFMDMMNQKDGVRRFNGYRSDVNKARSTCGDDAPLLPTYQEPDS